MILADADARSGAATATSPKGSPLRRVRWVGPAARRARGSRDLIHSHPLDPLGQGPGPDRGRRMDLSIREEHWQACGLDCPVLHGGQCRRGERTKCSTPVYSSAAAEILFLRTIVTTPDAEAGVVYVGTGWHALFVKDRAILNHIAQDLWVHLGPHSELQRAVSARRISRDENLFSAWEETVAHSATRSAGEERRNHRVQ